MVKWAFLIKNNIVIFDCCYHCQPCISSFMSIRMQTEVIACWDIFNISTSQKHDWAKIGLAGQHDQQPFKNHFEPWDPCYIVFNLSATKTKFSYLRFLLINKVWTSEAPSPPPWRGFPVKSFYQYLILLGLIRTLQVVSAENVESYKQISETVRAFQHI